MWDMTLAALWALSTPLPNPGTPFVEENVTNDWKESDGAPNVTEAQFNEILQAARDAYAPDARDRNEKLVIGGFWKETTVNGYTQRGFRNVVVTIYGGIAQRPEVTPDGFALVLCHELGHAYGGRPQKPLQFSISVEGQADFYGAGECLKRVLPRYSVPGFEAPATPYIARTCAERHPAAEEQSLCIRQLNAGYSAGRLLGFIKKTTAPDFETPDTTVVRSTLNNYPATIQCRLDTYQAAVLGNPRPRCWFAP